VISERLLSIVRCPDCGGQLARGTGSSRDIALLCKRCGRDYRAATGGFLDLRPAAAFGETTKYVDEALHADARHERVSPPLLSAAVRNDMLRGLLAPTRDDRVVDLGCGSGRALVWNQDMGAYQVGVDVSPFFAVEAVKQVDLVVGDLRKLPLADATFTKAFSLDVAEHLTRESLRAMLTEGGRVLVPGGALFLYTHVRKNSPLALGLRAVNRIAAGLDRLGLLDLSQEKLRKSDHLNPLADHDDFRRLAADAGFRIARVRYYTPLVGAVIENLLVRLAEGILARRAVRRLRSSGRSGKSAAADGVEGLRAARLDAKERISRGGMLYHGLRVLTWLSKLDIVLFGRIPSGPFFALLVKDGATGIGASRAEQG
jgi:SAM-dependent methyltransferase